MKLWIQKITIGFTLLVMIAGGTLAPFLRARAQTTNASFTISDGGVQLDQASGKYKWTIDLAISGGTLQNQSEVWVEINKVIPGSSQVVYVLPGQHEVLHVSNNAIHYVSPALLEAGTGYKAIMYKVINQGNSNIVSNNLILPPISATGTNTATTGNANFSETTAAQATASDNSKTSSLPVCWSGFTDGGFNVFGCVAQLVYYAIFVPTSFVFSLTGQLLDWSMGYSIDSSSYSGGGATFIEKGWRVTRDIANIFFIFILLWTAIGTILGLHSVNAQRTIVTVVLVALLLNFSLLFTRIIVDASNILGGIFYNSINTENVDPATIHNPWITDTKNISVAIVSKFNPQSIFKEVNSFKLNTSSGVIDDVLPKGSPPPGQFLIVSLIMAIINCVGIWVFLTAAFLFIGRVIGLWLSMIFAPIAFVSYILPDGASKILGDMHHGKWWDSLLKQAFVVPVFLFFMYLILAFLGTNFYKDALTAKTTTATILGVIIPLLLVAVLLTKARKIAVDMSGEIGGAMAKAASVVGGAVGGVALGMATGGAAMVGQRFIGARAKTYDTEERRDLAAGRVTDKIRSMSQFSGKSDEEIAKMRDFQKMQRGATRGLKTSRFFSNASFDVRQTGLGNVISQQTGLNMNAPGAFSVKATAGGYEGSVARDAEKKRKFADSLGKNHAHEIALGDSIDDRKKKISQAEDNAELLRDLAKQAQASGGSITGTYVDPGTGTKATATRTHAEWQDILKTQNESTRKLKKGEEIKWSDSDVGTVNPSTGATVTTADVGKIKTQFAWTAADVAAGKTRADGQKVTSNDVGTVAKTEFLSLDALEKAKTNNEKARLKAYMHQQMEQTGYPVHGEKYDQLGNITRYGHMDTDAKAEIRNWSKQVGAVMKSGISTGMTAGLTAAAFTGPVGAIVGAIGGGILGALKESNVLGQPFDRRLVSRSAELAADTDHKIHAFESTYKPPSSKILGIFSEVFASKGGGGGHEEHHEGSHASH